MCLFTATLRLQISRFFMIYLLTFNCQTSKIITLSELKDKLTSNTLKSYRRQKFDYTKIVACDFRFHVCSVYNYKTSSIHKNGH